jgi:hypothetical protein
MFPELRYRVCGKRSLPWSPSRMERSDIRATFATRAHLRCWHAVLHLTLFNVGYGPSITNSTVKKCCNTIMLCAALHNIVCLTRRKPSLMIGAAMAEMMAWTLHIFWNMREIIEESRVPAHTDQNRGWMHAMCARRDGWHGLRW